ncbi:MAG: alpha/beta hydrolase-fold protein, partial [Gemmataceae bacterium]
ADSRARLLTGHSSGGWSSLWLQVTYPGTFGGVWSTAPDPVDFRDFQKINLYQPGENMFKDRNGQDRPLGRRGDKPFLYYKPFSDMEEALARGGQLGSFEAVFSPKAVNGLPKKLWNRENGQIDLETAKAWQAYDIRLQLEKNWPNLANQLAGKIHVYMGDKDTFYLEGATQLLQQSLKKLGSEAVVELFPGKDHSNLLDAALTDRMKAEMAAALSKVR